MRRRTRKSILLLMGGLALAGFLQSRHLQRQLADSRHAEDALRQQRLQTLQALRQALQAPNNRRETSNATSPLAANERDYYQRRMQRLEERIAFLETAAIAVRAGQDTPPVPFDPGIDAPPGQAAYDTLMPFVTDPELREVLRLRMLASLEAAYQPLLEYFDFDAQSEDTLVALLLERQWNAMQYRMIDMQNNLDPELRAYALDALADDLQDLDAVLYNFLGAGDFAFYEAYRETQPERQQVNRLQANLSRHGLALNEDQEHDLILLMHAANAAVDAAILASLPPDADAPASAEAALAAYLAAAEEQQHRILEGAADMLSAEQLEFFLPFMDAQQALQETTIRQLIGPAP